MAEYLHLAVVEVSFGGLEDQIMSAQVAVNFSLSVEVPAKAIAVMVDDIVLIHKELHITHMLKSLTNDACPERRRILKTLSHHRVLHEATGGVEGCILATTFVHVDREEGVLNVARTKASDVFHSIKEVGYQGKGVGVIGGEVIELTEVTR